MKVPDYILQFLISKKIKNVFLMIGGAISFIIDAFSRNKKIKYICVGHEQSAAMMADAYARVGPKYGATMVTSGPGAQNLLTGIACSWFDSIPSIHICGQVNSSELSNINNNTDKVRQIGFQETDIVSIVKPITKFAYRIKKANEIKYILEKSFYLAHSGRPGPVLIDIPMNFQKEDINLKEIRSFNPPRQQSVKKNKLIRDINKLKDLLIKSKRPVLILGGGVRASNAVNNLYKFLHNFKLPIVTTWSGMDLIDYKNINYIGCIGVYGSRAANFTIQNADLIINLGSRLDTRVTGGRPSTFARGAKIISVDIDKYELNKNRGLKIYLKINYDLNIFLKFLNNKLKNFKYLADKDWSAKVKIWKEKYSNYNKIYNIQKKFVNPYFLIDSLSKILKKKDIIVADTGANLTWLMQVFKIKKGQRLFSAFGNSPMGYALPASIGASLVKNKKKIICITGDGGLQLNIQELQTVVANKLPIKIFVFDNEGYGIIKQFQELYLHKRYEATINKKGVTNPDFKKIAASYGINYNKIENHKKINLILRRVIRSNKAEFVHILINPNQKIIPKLEFGKPIEELSPQLKRFELLQNMIVPTINAPSKSNEIN